MADPLDKFNPIRNITDPLNRSLTPGAGGNQPSAPSTSGNSAQPRGDKREPCDIEEMPGKEGLRLVDLKKIGMDGLSYIINKENKVVGIKLPVDPKNPAGKKVELPATATSVTLPVEGGKAQVRMDSNITFGIFSGDAVNQKIIATLQNNPNLEFQGFSHKPKDQPPYAGYDKTTYTFSHKDKKNMLMHIHTVETPTPYIVKGETLARPDKPGIAVYPADAFSKKEYKWPTLVYVGELPEEKNAAPGMNKRAVGFSLSDLDASGLAAYVNNLQAIGAATEKDIAKGAATPAPQKNTAPAPKAPPMRPPGRSF